MESTKPELRQSLKRARLNMPAGQASEKGRVIAKRLISRVAWAGIANMHVYSSVSGWNEVQTGPIIKYVRKKWPEIMVTQPGTSAGQRLPEEKFDLIIVPCLGFDKELYRLGLGAGFYDRFLASQPAALKIGLAFANGFVKTGLPREAHDIPLDEIITEEAIIKAHDR